MNLTNKIELQNGSYYTFGLHVEKFFDSQEPETGEAADLTGFTSFLKFPPLQKFHPGSFKRFMFWAFKPARLFSLQAIET